MSKFPNFIPTLPGPVAVFQAAKAWVVANGLWWASSFVGHVVVLSAILLLVGKVAARPKLGDAPAFESPVDTELPVPEIDRFEVGETPLEPTELTTETLSLVEAPSIDTNTEIGDASDAMAGGGGSAGGATGGIGGLDQFAVRGLGPGPLVRGTGLSAGGSGTGIGSGGDGSGFGARGDKNARRAMVGGYGGTKASERAVAAALNWLARHQNPDGSWGLAGFSQHCRGSVCSGPGSAKSDGAATAMALLPFLAAGQTHYTKRSPYRATVQNGLNWLIRSQKQTGDLQNGHNMYTHGLSAIVLCEAYALTKDSRLRFSAEGAIRFIESAQVPQTGGWHYKSKPTTPGDTSIVGWQVMAIKSAEMAGLQVSPAAIEGAHKWLGLVAHGKNKGLFSYNAERPASLRMSAVGLLCSQYLGAKRDDPAIQEGLTYLMNRLPTAETHDVYYWYYATQVMHNVPGPEWDKWNREMRRVLIDTQVKEGCAAGSWDPFQPAPDPYAEEGGRIMITSLSCLTLEVYYRYLPLYKLDTQDDDSDPANKTASSAK